MSAHPAAIVVGIAALAGVVALGPRRGVSTPGGERRRTDRPLRGPVGTGTRSTLRTVAFGSGRSVWFGSGRSARRFGVRSSALGDRRGHGARTDASVSTPREGRRSSDAWRGRRPGSHTGERGARWATARDLGALRLGHPEDGRLILGRAIGRRGTRREVLLAAEPARSLAVVGPTQSGKTTAVAVPAMLAWCGPVLAASVKTDLLRDTLTWRQRCGTAWCFDPAGSTGLPSDPWSPLPAARTWSGARRVAADLTEVARGDATMPDGDFWYATAAKLLAPLLFAAANTGRSMTDVVRWVDTQCADEVADLLEAAGEPVALQAARATWLRDDRQRSSVYTTAETILEPFADLARAARPPVRGGVDAAGLLLGAHTLYLCAPAHDQRRLRALFTALVKQVLEAAFARAAALGGPLRPPLLVVLDEAANIAPLAELDGLAATCAGHGIQLVTVWQDLAQVSARYGARAATVVNNHTAKIFLSGIADPGTLEHASHLIGDEELLLPSITRDAAGGRSTTRAPLQRRLLPPDALRRQAPGTGVLLYGNLPPVRLALQPWWEDSVLAPRGGHDPADAPGAAAEPGRLD